MPDPEILPCPECGVGVSTVGGPGHWTTDAEGVHSHATELGANCPSCGTSLIRDNLPGAPWRRAEA